ncbi:MAG: hypothetical protein Q4B22_01835 [Eubacteriales bacterium]|nr:hypothetical protein [Eubacteriales bacterium]
MGTEKREYLKNLYIGEQAQEQKRAVMRAIARGRSFPGLYLITIAASESEQLDIWSSLYLNRQDPNQPIPLIVGAAMGKEEAFRVVERIARDSFLATGACDLKEYLLHVRNKQEGSTW